MGFFLWIIVGGLSGWLAGLIMRGDGFGLLGNIAIGIVGALVGGGLGELLKLDWAKVSGFNLASIATSVLGALFLLIILRLIKG